MARGLQKMEVDITKVLDVKLSEVFGNEKIKVTEMMKRLWAFIKLNAILIKEGENGKTN